MCANLCELICHIYSTSPFAHFIFSLIQNKGRDPNQYSNEFGGAFFVRGTTPAESTLTLNDCTLRNNVALSDSGVIDSIEASVIAIDSVFTENRSGNDGGVGYIDGVSQFLNCRFEGNYADRDANNSLMFCAPAPLAA